MTRSVRRSDRLRIQVLVVLVAVMAAACASGGAMSPAGAPAGAPLDGGEALPSMAPAEPQDGSGGQRPGDGGNERPSALQPDLKVVYTGSLDLVVDDLAASLAEAKAAVLATGGYIGASEERNDEEWAVATITYRIPAARWDDTIDALRAIATRVVGGQTHATEVGGQLIDLEARLRNLRASEQVLVEIAGGTGKISDLLEVQARITEVRDQIERLDAQRAQLVDQVAYGTLVTTFGVDVVQVTQAAKGWDPASDVDGATATLIGFGQALVSAGIWFAIVWLPLLLVVVVLALVARWAVRRFVPRGRPVGPISGWGPEA